ncbi:MAG: DUF47 domain-containing protein [Planctomycetes bacterium]|nr:DUF47 domain-containing protein [Planctomycetota bacterium]
MGRLLPRETSFFDFFEQHARLAVEGAREFVALATEGTNIPVRARRIKELEHEADVCAHRCAEALHKTFITPMDREDIHRLIGRLDDVLDEVEAASERIHLYEIGQMTPELRQMAEVLLRQTELVVKALEGLRDLGDPRRVLDLCIEINKLENEGDALLREAVARLFKEEHDPIAIIKWKEIYEHVENATDRCEDVADVIEDVVLENA